MKNIKSNYELVEGNFNFNGVTVNLFFDPVSILVKEEKLSSDGSSVTREIKLDDFDASVYGEVGQKFLDKIKGVVAPTANISRRNEMKSSGYKQFSINSAKKKVPEKIVQDLSMPVEIGKAYLGCDLKINNWELYTGPKEQDNYFIFRPSDKKQYLVEEKIRGMYTVVEESKGKLGDNLVFGTDYGKVITTGIEEVWKEIDTSILVNKKAGLDTNQIKENLYSRGFRVTLIKTLGNTDKVSEYIDTRIKREEAMTKAGKPGILSQIRDGIKNLFINKKADKNIIESKLKQSLIDDVMNTAYGLYSMNAPYAKYYAFSVLDDGTGIHSGSFENKLEEAKTWPYYIELATKKINKSASLNIEAKKKSVKSIANKFVEVYNDEDIARSRKELIKQWAEKNKIDCCELDKAVTEILQEREILASIEKKAKSISPNTHCVKYVTIWEDGVESRHQLNENEFVSSFGKWGTPVEAMNFYWKGISQKFGDYDVHYETLLARISFLGDDGVVTGIDFDYDINKNEWVSKVTASLNKKADKWEESKDLINDENITGDKSNIYGDAKNLEGNVSDIEGNVSDIEGNVSNLKGDVSYIYGNVSDIYGNVSNLKGDVSYIKGNVSYIKGNVSNIEGDASNIKGNVSDIIGDVSNIIGDVSNIYGKVSNLKGDVSNIIGDVGDIEGNVSNIIGDVSDIEGNVSNLEGDVSYIEGDVYPSSGKLLDKDLIDTLSNITDQEKAEAIVGDNLERVRELKDKINNPNKDINEIIKKASLTKKADKEFEEEEELVNDDNITGDKSNIYGDAKDLEGDVGNMRGNVTNMRGNVSNITGNVSNIIGDVTNIEGNVSFIRGCVSLLEGNVTYLEGNVTKIWGDASNIEGDVSNIFGDVSKIFGNVSNLKGDVSYIKGDVSDIYGNVSNIKGNVSYIIGNVSDIKGNVSNIEGNVSNIKGNVSNIYGNVSNIEGYVSDIEGDVSNLKGNVSNLEGDVSNLKGNVSNLKGDVTNIKSDTSSLEASLDKQAVGTAGPDKSDKDIAAEFANYIINESEFKINPSEKSGVIVIDFPEAGESVAGGGVNEVVDYWTLEPSGNIGFTHWYPENVYNELSSYIEDKLEVSINKTAERPPKPTKETASPGMKWVFNETSNSWTQVPETTETTEVTSELNKQAKKGPQSIIFNKKKWSVAEAKKWLKDNGYKFGDVDTTDNYHRFRQYEPGKNVRTKTISFGTKGKGIKAIIEYSKKTKACLNWIKINLELDNFVVNHFNNIKAKLVQKYRKDTERKEYALVSIKNPEKILKWFGVAKPSEEEVLKQERRVQWFKNN